MKTKHPVSAGGLGLVLVQNLDRSTIKALSSSAGPPQMSVQGWSRSDLHLDQSRVCKEETSQNLSLHCPTMAAWIRSKSLMVFRETSGSAADI